MFSGKLQKRFHLSIFSGNSLFFKAGNPFQNILIRRRNDLLEMRKPVLRVIQDLFRKGRPSFFQVVLQDLGQIPDIVLLFYFLQQKGFFAEVPVEHVVFIQNVGDSAAHSGCEVLPGLAENDCCSAGHIFQTMIPASLTYS